MSISEKELNQEAIPSHVAIILDGNGRWAKQRGLPHMAGHKAGAENLRHVIESSVECGIHTLTICAFSTETWQRPEAEVNGLMLIFEDVIERELHHLHHNGIQLQHIGNLDGLRPSLVEKLLNAIEITKNNKRLILNVALNYGGRLEIVEAIQSIVRAGIAAKDVDEELMRRYLCLSEQPSPDLIIHTAGNIKVSDFLIWQATYAEDYVTPTLWPDFGQNELLQSIKYFARRERRFGVLPNSK